MRDDNSHDNQSVALTSGNSCFASCATYNLNLCEVIVKLEQSDADCHAINLPLTASLYTIPARRTIHHPDVSSEFVSSICKGWATLAVVLPDDRRQILSFLLPGDMFSIASLYEPISGHMVESVTEVTYRSFKRGDLRTIIFARPDLHARFTAAWIEEKRQIEQLAVDLGCGWPMSGLPG